MPVEGTYDCVTRTPMGELASRFTVERDGDRFFGRNEGTLGAMAVTDGRVEGERLTWTMALTAPMALTLACEATIDGDTLTGCVRAEGFGPMPMRGTRVGG
jgi:hypothetical protein